jgi:clan AA aspartic protease (TIGR02281 family)
MPQLFTVKWPDFAWIEASLFFPVAVLMAFELVISGLAGNMFAGPAMMGLIIPAIAAGALFLGLLVAVDRLLIVRKGFAILSVLATIIWASAALVLAPRLSTTWPSSLVGPDWLPFRTVATLVAIGLSLLAHRKILWIGLHDTGFAAGRLGVELKTNKLWRARLSRYQSEAPIPPLKVKEDVGETLTQDLVRDLKLLFRRLTESIVFQVLIGCSMGIVLLACWIAYANRDSAGPLPPAPPPAEQAADASAAPEPAASVPVVITRDNEGSGELDAEGRYLFNVAVNGIPMPMRYDDDVPLVTIRAEDALRLGISFARLDFSTKIKTAKGQLTDVAGITISSMTVGKITYRLVPGYVTRPGALEENILGHSFLGRLADYRVEQKRLVLIDRQGQSETVSAIKPSGQ